MIDLFEDKENKTRGKWDRIYDSADASIVPAACDVLTDFQHLLPLNGHALDVACGLGGNSLLLAERHLDVTAIDISSVAIDRIEQWQNPHITTRCISINSAELPELSYDIIVVSRYLDRSICSALVNALRPGGLLFYQTFTRDKANPDEGPSNPEYLLASNELLSLFSELKVLAFSDQGTTGTLSDGFRNQSYLVAHKE